jgi:hypothetical protein
MELDALPGATRRLDAGTFTGDAWALQASLAVPGELEAVPRLVATGDGPVRWSVLGMAGTDPEDTQVSDDTTSLSTCLVKLSRTAGGTVVRALAASSGTLLGREVVEDDVRAGDLILIAVPTFTAGTAPAVWVQVHGGAKLAPAGAP